jgi:cell wall-associated NlpC family hydrolase
LPRDAYQQFYVGRLSATRWHTASLRRGDTLYFLGPDGKIRHTALYLGDNHYLQAVEPVVRISSFNPEDPDYDAKRHEHFAFAKRPLE